MSDGPGDPGVPSVSPPISTEFWRRCSSCKTPIGYKKAHFVCSVSTCTRKRTGYVFCSVSCWERHLPGARHRDAAAVEAMAPNYEQWKQELESEHPPATASNNSNSNNSSSKGPGPSANPGGPLTAPLGTAANFPKRVIAREAPAPPKEILVVVSKLKAYIKARSDMNTSDTCMEVLSDRVRALCDEAIEMARKAGRKTVMDRDFE